MVKINPRFPLDLQEKLREILGVVEKREQFSEPTDRERAVSNAHDCIIEEYLEKLGAMPIPKVF